MKRMSELRKATLLYLLDGNVLTSYNAKKGVYYNGFLIKYFEPHATIRDMRLRGFKVTVRKPKTPEAAYYFSQTDMAHNERLFEQIMLEIEQEINQPKKNREFVPFPELHVNKDVAQRKYRKLTAQEKLVCEIVSEAVGLEYGMIFMCARHRKIVDARKLAYLWMHKFTDRTLSEIGTILHYDRADHSTVIHGIKTAKDLIDKYSTHAEVWDKIRKIPAKEPKIGLRIHKPMYSLFNKTA